MKWHKMYLRKMTDEEKEYYNGKYDEIWDGYLPEVDQKVLVTYEIAPGIYADACVDIWVEIDYGLAFEDTDADVIYWTELPKFEGE